MQLLSCYNGQLQTATVTSPDGISHGKSRGFDTGLSALDDLLPDRRLARGAVHELLALPQHPFPLFVALLLSRSALIQSQQILQPQMNTDEHRLIENSLFYLRSSAFICGSDYFEGAVDGGAGAPPASCCIELK
jgi:hypothetical protein